MTKTILPVSFFFGANNKIKYSSLYDELYNPFEKGNHIILKGGPGTGKSTFMRRIAEKLEKEGLFVERGFCSADPTSLDVVAAPEINFSIFDGTSPHVVDPIMPGVSEHIVDLGVAWRRELLKENIRAIGDLTRTNRQLHDKTAEFMHVGAQLETQSAIISSKFIDEEKLQRFTLRLANRLLPNKKSNEKGRVHKRFLSAVSPDGIAVQHDTIVALSEEIITIRDEYGTVSPYITSYICDCAVEKGYDVYACYCPLFPRFKMEHIIIPELKIAVFTENSYHYSVDDEGKRINATRFYDKNIFAENKEKLVFLKKAKKEIIDEAVRKVSLAKDIHDKLEAYYVSATDFDVINEIGEKIISKL